MIKIFKTFIGMPKYKSPPPPPTKEERKKDKEIERFKKELKYQLGVNREYITAIKEIEAIVDKITKCASDIPFSDRNREQPF